MEQIPGTNSQGVSIMPMLEKMKEQVFNWDEEVLKSGRRVVMIERRPLAVRFLEIPAPSDPMVVDDIKQDGEAYNAGIRKGDIVKGLNGNVHLNSQTLYTKYREARTPFKLLIERPSEVKEKDLKSPKGAKSPKEVPSHAPFPKSSPDQT